jgi:SAM-dependent methyltransferase
MERATKDQFVRTSLLDEHAHRYELAARFARGVVVDCACGIGYGSVIVSRQGNVETYLGIDPSREAIQYAHDNYSGGRIYFECGTLESNSCLPFSVDSFLMFETLEHTENPSAALANVRRCLKPDGLLIGSVPSAEYEALCESTYGPNPFHLQRFTKEQIERLLGEYFEDARILSMEFILGSLVRCIDEKTGKGAEILPSSASAELGVLGSIVFVAGTTSVVALAMSELGAPNIYFPSIPKAISDREEVAPIRTAMQSMEALIRERDEAIGSQAKMLEERWAAMQSMEALIRERDEAIGSQAKMLEERWAAMQSMEALIRERGEVIDGQAKILEERRAAMQSMESVIRERDEIILGQVKMLEERRVAMQSMEAMILHRDKVILEQQQLIERRPETIEAMHALLYAIKASLRRRISRVFGKI